MHHIRAFVVFSTIVLVSLGCAHGGGGGSILNRSMLQEGSRPLAYQTAAFARTFETGALMQWQQTMRMVKADVIPFLRTAKEKKISFRIEVHEKLIGETIVYDVDLIYLKKGGKEVRATATTGEPVAFESHVDRMARATGLPLEQVRAAHMGLYAMANMMVVLNVSYETMNGMAFARIAMAEKLKAGERQIDYFDPNRSMEESLADVDLSLSVIAVFNKTVQQSRAEVLVATALAAQYAQDGVLDELDLLCDEAIVRGGNIPQAATPEEFGVVARALPDPKELVDELMGDLGFAKAVFDVAKAVVSRDPRGFLDAAAKLAPKDTKVRTALDTLASAAHGDVAAVIDGVAKLTGNEEVVEDVKARLSKFEALKPLVKGVAGKIR
jgi:hypothetical protein